MPDVPFELTWADHGLMILSAVVLPAVGWFRYRKHAMRLERVPTYVRSSGVLLVQVALCLTLWGSYARPWSDLGLPVHGGTRFWITAAYLFLLLGTLYLSQRRRLRRPRFRERVVANARRWAALVPRTDEELRAFVLFSVVVGCGEELIFRGFVTRYLSAYVPFLVAIPIGALLFGLAHAYQGLRGIATTSLLGLLFGGVYAVSGSLLLPAVAHFGWNVMAAIAARTVLFPLEEDPAALA